MYTGTQAPIMVIQWDGLSVDDRLIEGSDCEAVETFSGTASEVGCEVSRNGN
jgi:hypothetical protein